MKYFLLLLLAVGLFFWVRSRIGLGRRPTSTPAEQPEASFEPDESSKNAAGEPLLTCAQCGVHVPQSEAWPGRGGVFCGDSHRLIFEKAHPPL